jgi:hypothetical protein
MKHYLHGTHGEDASINPHRSVGKTYGSSLMSSTWQATTVGPRKIWKPLENSPSAPGAVHQRSQFAGLALAM